MDTIYNIEEGFRSEKGFDEVFASLEKALSEMGGTFSSNKTAGTISILNGKGGMFGDFLMESEAQFTLKEKGTGEYLLTGSLKKKPSAIFWVCLIGGICLLMSPIGIIGIVGVVFYFVMDLEAEYRKRLAKMMGEMETSPEKAKTGDDEGKADQVDEDAKGPREAKEPPDE